MKSNCQKLNHHHIHDLAVISKEEGFPYPITEDAARVYCQNRDASDTGVQTYGILKITSSSA